MEEQAHHWEAVEQPEAPGLETAAEVLRAEGAPLVAAELQVVEVPRAVGVHQMVAAVGVVPVFPRAHQSLGVDLEVACWVAGSPLVEVAEERCWACLMTGWPASQAAICDSRAEEEAVLLQALVQSHGQAQVANHWQVVAEAQSLVVEEVGALKVVAQVYSVEGSAREEEGLLALDLEGDRLVAPSVNCPAPGRFADHQTPCPFHCAGFSWLQLSPSQAQRGSFLFFGGLSAIIRDEQEERRRVFLRPQRISFFSFTANKEIGFWSFVNLYRVLRPCVSFYTLVTLQA